MSVSSDQSYKEIVQLALRAEKLTSKRMSRGKFQKRKGFGFVLGQSSKKSRSSESFDNSSEFGIDSNSSLQTFKIPQPFRLGTSPPSSTFKGRMISERCPLCNQFHSEACSMPKEYVFDVVKLVMLRNAAHC